MATDTMKAGDVMVVTAKDNRGKKVTLLRRAGLIVPGPAWWVEMPDGTESLYDDFELKALP